MIWENPDAWWLLAAGIPMVALHLHLRRRRDHVVPSIDIWRGLATSRTRKSGLKALRDRAGLLLALLGLFLLTAALAGPTSGDEAALPIRVAIVVDGSATMNAETTDGGTRIRAAVEAARGAMRKLRDGDEVTVWVAGDAPRVLVDPTFDVRRAYERVLAAEATLAPRSLSSTVRLAKLAATRRGDRKARVLVFTDGAGAAALPEDEGVVVAAVDAGESAANAGIERVALPPDAPGVAVVRIVRTDGPPVPRRLQLLRDGRVLSTLDVPGEAEVELRVDLGPVAAGGPCALRLDPPDAFPHDDRLGLVLPAPLRLRALVIAADARPSPFLSEALRAVGDLLDVEGTRVASAAAAGDVYGDSDVVIVEGALPGDLPASMPVLSFSETGGTLVERPLLWTEATHEVLAGVDVSPLRLDRVAVLDPTAAETVLLASSAGAVALAGEDEGVRWVRFGFRAEASTLALEPAYPLLVRNALRWLGSPRRLPPYVTAGGPLLTSRVNAPELRVAGPGRRVAVVPVKDGRIDFVVPRPGPRDATRLLVTTRAGTEETEVHWDRPRAFRIGAAGDAPTAPTPEAALATLPDPYARAGDRKRHAPQLAGLAALALIAGAFLLKPPSTVQRISDRVGPELLMASTQMIKLPANLR